jgi:hypothetical protein
MGLWFLRSVAADSWAPGRNGVRLIGEEAAVLANRHGLEGLSMNDLASAHAIPLFSCRWDRRSQTPSLRFRYARLRNAAQ